MISIATLPPGAKESHRHSTIQVLQSAEEPHTEGVLQSGTTCYKVLRSATKCQGAVHRLSIAYKELQSTAKCQADGKSGVTMMEGKTVAAGDQKGGGGTRHGAGVANMCNTTWGKNTGGAFGWIGGQNQIGSLI